MGVNALRVNVARGWGEPGGGVNVARVYAVGVNVVGVN